MWTAARCSRILTRGCTVSPQDFSCVKMDQILEVELSESGTGTMLAKRVEFVEKRQQAGD